MLKRYERSRDVYENKETHDKMPAEKSDIDVEMARILQKIAGLWGQFVLNGGLESVILRLFSPLC
jgi:hypothetical protein